MIWRLTSGRRRGRLAALVTLVTLLLVDVISAAYASDISQQFIQARAAPPPIACKVKLVCFVTHRDDRSVQVWMEVNTVVPVSIAFRSEASGVEGAPRSFSKVVASPTRELVLDLNAPADSNWRYSWDYNAHIGSETAVHDTSAVYRLPYPSGQTFEVSQGFGGNYSHSGRNRYAIDWRMREGTVIVAARSGVVVGLREDSNTTKAGEENFIWIQHDDGTVGHYLHLKRSGVTVTKGQRVGVGDPIGLSGHTGLSTEPHLHFHVSTPTPGERDSYKTFPILFRVSGGSVIELRQDRYYAAD